MILSGAIETEHHEIAVYEVLVTNAEARGAPEVAALLRENLEQEQHTLEEVKSVAERLANEGYAVASWRRWTDSSHLFSGSGGPFANPPRASSGYLLSLGGAPRVLLDAGGARSSGSAGHAPPPRRSTSFS